MFKVKTACSFLYTKAVQIYCGLQFRKWRKCSVALNMSAVSARLIASKGTKANNIKHTGSRFSMNATSSSPRRHGFMLLLFVEASADDADSSRRRVPRDDKISTEFLYLDEASRAAALFTCQAISTLYSTSRIQSEDTNLEACRHLECIERVPTSSLERGERATVSFNLH